jgi:hypothetical protein
MSLPPRFLLLVLASATLFACHKKKSGPPAFELTCKKGCARVQACHEEADAAECESACLESYSFYGDNLNKEFLHELDECFADLDCDEVGLSAHDNHCRSQALQRTPASLKVVDLCERIMDPEVECPPFQLDEEVCLATVKLFNDATVEDTLACFEGACEQFRDCFNDTLGLPAAAPLDQ